MSENGQVATEVAEQAVAEAAEPPRRYRLDADELTPKDMKRARVMLGGRNPWELLDDPDDQFTLIMWCLLSRADPSFTWEQAEETPFGRFDPAVPRDPPPTPPSESLGKGSGTANVDKPKARRPKPASEPSSASSTG